MKKSLAIAAMVAMVPCAAHAKTAISDTDMNKVTGQAGVSIDMDVRLDITADTVAWGQNDGVTVDATHDSVTSWVGMKGFGVNNMTVKLRPDLLSAVVTDTLTLARLSSDSSYTVGSLSHADSVTYMQNKLATDKANVKPLTIDVATVGTATAADGSKSDGTTYVRFGLGSLEIAAKSIDFGVGLGKTVTSQDATKNTTLSSAALNQDLGSVHIGDLAMELNGGSTVDIYSISKRSGNTGTGSGVVFDLNVTLDRMTASSISWGNTAGSVNGPSTSAGGAQASTSAGYVGLANLNVNNLTFTGPVSIQVGTVSQDTATAAGNLAAAYATGGTTSAAYQNALSAYYYSLYTSIGTGKAMSASFVHFGLGTGDSTTGSALANSGGFVFGMGSMSADVKVASSADLATGAGTYGTMGINNLKVGMNGWVNIGTH